MTCSAPRSTVAMTALALAACVGKVSAQGLPLRIQTLNASDGLSSGVTTALHRDRAGMLWIGTPGGLNRYDGHEVETLVHDPGRPVSLPDNHVRAILEDRSGSLLVGTAGGGLSRLDRGTRRFERIPLPSADPVASDWVETLMQDRSGRLWVGTLGGGVVVLGPDPGHGRRYLPDEADPGALSHPLVNVIFEDAAGRIWVGTDRGLNRWDPGQGRFVRYLSDAADSTTLPHDRVLSIRQDSLGTLWVGTEVGLARVDPGSGTFDRIPHDGRPGAVSHPHVTALIAGTPGTLWVGTYGGGLNELDVERGRVIAVRGDGADSDLGDARIRRMAAGEGGSIWIGSWGGGVSRASRVGVAFDLIAHDPGNPGSLAPGDATDVAVDAQSGLWVATLFTGVHWRRRGEERFVSFLHDATDPLTMSGDDAYRLLVSSSGHLWVGTLQSGLNRLDPSTGRVDRYAPSADRAEALSSNRVTALLEDGSGTLWIGTSNGLDRLDDPSPPGRFVSVPGLEGDYVEALLDDGSGSMWIGTAGGGLVRMNPRSLDIARFRARPGVARSLSHDHVTSLARSPTGTLWVGTLGGGVNRVREEGDAFSFEPHVETDGLLGNSVASMLWDERSRLWVATREGLSILDESGAPLYNVDGGNGLPVGEFSPGSVASSGEHHYFGSPSGVVVAPRDPVLPEPMAAPVVVTRARALGSDSALSLDPATTPPEVAFGEVLQFHFAVLDYDGRRDEMYAYRLEGLGEGWVDLGSTREIAFSNLEPGAYALFVRGSARHGPWIEASAPVRFVVVPPFWMTWWFRILAVLCLLGLGAGVVAVRLRHMSAREEAVRKKENQFRALLENSHDLVSILDSEGRVQFLGPSVERILGYDPDQRRGRLTAEIVHPEDLEPLKRWLEQVFSGDAEAGVATIRVRAADGEWHVLESVASAFTLPDGKRGAIVNARDVTERVAAEARSRELEQALHQRQKLEAIGTLAGGVAHEFNNLLTVIGGHASLLEEDAGDEAATRDSAAAILRAQQSGAALTRQLLAFARKQVVSQGAIDVNELLEGLERLFQRLVGEQVTLDLVLAADRPWVEADEGQLEQVLMNLVVNARDAMPDGGRLEIRTENMHVDEQVATASDLTPGQWLILRVTDTGIGIDPEALPHVFEPFYTTKPRGKGTGLGLSTAYGIVTQSGGHLTVESEPGAGTSFRIFLRGTDAPASRPAAGTSPERHSHLGAGTVLVAEDDPQIRALVGRVLRRRGYTVVEARDGLEALRLLQAAREPPRVMLTDLIMPGLNGAELAGRARELWRDMPVVFMTGYDDGTVLREGLDPTAQILHKPFTPSNLAARIHQILEGSHKDPWAAAEPDDGE